MRKKDGISSNPTADLRLRFMRCFKTSSSVTARKLNWCSGKFSGVGLGLQIKWVNGKTLLLRLFATLLKNCVLDWYGALNINYDINSQKCFISKLIISLSL